MLYTLESVKANIRNRDGKRVFYLGKGDQITAGGRDFLSRERIEILPASQAKPDRYRLLCGGYLSEKPEHMTHLNSDILVSKTHPRIAFRGAMDTLEAELLICQLGADAHLRQQLEEVLQLARKIVRADVMDEPMDDTFTICEMTHDQLRARSHRPQDYYGQPHFMPAATDGAVILQLNRARCIARNVERVAMEAFSDREGIPVRYDIVQILNRISSALYIFMIEQKALSTPDK